VEIAPHELTDLKDRGFVKIRGRQWKIGEEVFREKAAA
jgi:hypothetical protein